MENTTTVAYECSVSEFSDIGIPEKLYRYYRYTGFPPFKLDRIIPLWKFEGNFDFE